MSLMIQEPRLEHIPGRKELSTVINSIGKSSELWHPGWWWHLTYVTVYVFAETSFNKIITAEGKWAFPVSLMNKMKINEKSLSSNNLTLETKWCWYMNRGSRLGNINLYLKWQSFENPKILWEEIRREVQYITERRNN